MDCLEKPTSMLATYLTPGTPVVALPPSFLGLQDPDLDAAPEQYNAAEGQEVISAADVLGPSSQGQRQDERVAHWVALFSDEQAKPSQPTQGLFPDERYKYQDDIKVRLEMLPYNIGNPKKEQGAKGPQRHSVQIWQYPDGRSRSRDDPCRCV